MADSMPETDYDASPRGGVFRQLAAIADQEGDSDQDRLEHRFLILAGSLMSGGGLLWGTIAAGSGLWQHSLVPFGYVVVTIINFLALARWKRFATARRVQVAASILLPFLFQWVLGGFAASGGMMYWGMVGLVGSLSFDDVPTSLRLLVLYVALVVTSATIDAFELLPVPEQLGGRGLGSVFVGMNFVVVSSIVFFLMLYFVRSRHDAHQALMARNVELAASTERARDASRKADAANEARGRFLAVVSHEMRTPLHGILGLTNLVLETELTPRQRELLLQAHVSAETLGAIINDVLDFSKIEAGGVALERIPFRLDDVLHRLTSSANALALKRGLEFVLEVDQVPPVLVGDPTRLGQILLNLVSNAVKFTEQGEVHVRLSSEEVDADALLLRVEVRDTGVGIEPDQAERLFQPFEQIDDSTTRKYGGTGLGLAICRAFVEMMGGSIRVESRPGHGSTFSFVVPLGFAEDGERIVPRELESMRALVVDDNESARLVVMGYLQSFDIEAVAVDSGEAALAAADGSSFGLVLADLKMPGIDGIELIRRLRVHPNTGDARMVLVTAFGSRSDEEAAAEAGADAFLAKPLRPSTLLDRLVQLFADAPGEAPTSHAPRRTTAEPIRGARVLVVEDNDINREILVSSLRSRGLCVDVAVDGRDGWMRATEADSAWDLILMDVQMPVMDGFEATRAIRGAGVVTPIIGVTANALAEARSACLDAGMDEVVTKPIHMELLVSTMIRAVGSSFVPREAGEAPAEEVTDRGDFVPVIEGIDTQEGLTRSAGNVGLYRELLLRFRDGHITSAAEIRSHLANGDPAFAQRVAHTLKGVSGNIGAHRVYNAASDVHTRITDGDDDAVSAALDTLEQALHQTGRAMASAFGRADEPAGAEETAVASCSDEDIAELVRLVEDADARAVEHFRRVEAGLTVRWGGPLVEALASALDAFDFVLAADVLATGDDR